ncbi:hypothetical protein [Nitrobacter sp. JJSN]|uniref:hypothetical protein n=1 Tax=Nitrobacter sp. JJSN TaxID=3453033 RepID=UPI003F7628F7
MRSLVLAGMFGLMASIAVDAWAACSSPAANAGDQSFDSTQNVMVYCDGSNWISMAGGVSVTIGGTTNVPGGSANQVQYNNGSGGFAGDSGLTYSSGLLTVTNVSATNMSASGNVTAGAFYGDGSHLTGVGAGDRIVSGSVSAIAQQSTGMVSISGTLALNNTGSETCDATHAYSLRIDPTTKMVQMCRP